MKQIIFFILFMPLLIFGQMTEQQKISIIMGGDDRVYEPEITAFQNALTTKLNFTTLDTLDQFIKMLKDSLGLAKGQLTLRNRYDRIWLLWLPTAESSLKDLIYLSDASNVNGLKFTPWKGYGGDTNTFRYINTNYNPLNQATVYTLNNARIGILCNTNVESNCYDIGNDYSKLQIYYSGKSYYSQVNSTTYSSFSGTITSGNALFTSVRTDANYIYDYRNGISLGAGQVRPAVSIINGSFFISCQNHSQAGTSVPLNFSAKLYPVVFIGNSATAIEIRGEYNCFNWLKTKEGF